MESFRLSSIERPRKVWTILRVNCPAALTDTDCAPAMAAIAAAAVPLFIPIIAKTFINLLQVLQPHLLSYFLFHLQIS